MAKRLRLQEPAPCDYEVGERVVYTPLRGPAQLCSVRSVGPVLGLEAQGCQGLCYVPVSSSGLKKAPSDLEVLRRLLQGLEAKSESDALRFSQRQRMAYQELRPAGERVPFEPPRSGGKCSRLSPSFWGMEHPAQGSFELEHARAVFESCCQGYEPPCSLLLDLARKAKELISAEPMVLRLSAPLVVLGDTHGHFKDLVHIWKSQGLPGSELTYLLNGDICDRGDSERRGGQRALQIWACVLAFKVAMPSCIYVTRGNHEDRDYWPQYGAQGFSGEIEAKFPDRREADELLNGFGDLCDVLPLAATCGPCLVMHGGLPRCWVHGANLEELDALERPLCIPEKVDGRQQQLIYDATWADPQLENGLGPNDRGGDAISFGPDVTAAVLRSLGLRLFLRSHELPGRGCEDFKGRGFEWWHRGEELMEGADGLCLSVFSCSDYCGCLDNNCGARVVFEGDSFRIIEHRGWEAEQSFPPKRPSEPEERLLFEGPLERGVIEALVERKHELLRAFTAADESQDWLLPVESWEECCRQVLPQIPWKDLAKRSSIVPRRGEHVNYMLFLTRYQVRFNHKQGFHASFHRRMASRFFGALLAADATLQTTLRALDLNGDGRVSASEFAAALRQAAGVMPTQALALYRTAAEQGGDLRVEEFLGVLSVNFALVEPRPAQGADAFVPKVLNAICRDILQGHERPAVLLRRFFEVADVNKNGYLELSEFKAALRELPSASALKEEELEKLCRYVDLNSDGRLNYAELLRALYVRCGQGAKAFLEDALETVHRVLHFEFARPLRSLLRRLAPGRSRCTAGSFRRALQCLNCGHLSEGEITCLVESIDMEAVGDEEEAHFDFEDFLDSFSIVDSLEDPEEEDLWEQILKDV